MRRMMRWAARLYPAAWRARYGDELDVLLDDAGPRWADAFDILRGALTMQVATLNFWKIAAAFAIAGAMTAGAWSLTQSDRYVSSAVLRISDPSAGVTRMQAWLHMQALQQEVLSRHSLSNIIQEQKLYDKERSHEPLEDIVQTMRVRDLLVKPMSGGEFTVTFANQDRAAAQATVRAVVAAFAEANVAHGKLNLEVVRPASLPDVSSVPDRPRVIFSGLMAGLLVGAVVGALYTIARGRKQWSLRLIAAFAVAGMAIGLTIAMSIPDRFVSMAVLRTSETDKFGAALRTALSDASIDDVIMKYELYPAERRSMPIAQVIGKMRNTAIQVRIVELPADTQARAFTVAFAYTDRYKAQMVTQELVARISGTVRAEVLDPPSMPMAPSSPNRLQIGAFGLFAGTLLGLAASRLRRPPLATA